MPTEEGNEFSPAFVHELSVAMGVTSGVSLVSCLSVIVLIYTRESLYKKNLCKFVMIIMWNEVGHAIGTSLGNSTNGSFDCWLQAFLTSYFPYCQSLWLSLTAWMLHRIIFYSKPTNLLSVHSFVLCSGLPVILALLPLTTNDYGNEGDSSGWCFLMNRSDSPSYSLTMWTVFHYTIIYLNIAAYVIVLWLARKRLNRSRKSLPGKAGGIALSGIMSLLRQLIWFPVVIFVAILPECLYDILASMGTVGGKDLNNNAAFIYVSHVGAISGGFFMALAFILSNDDANAEVRVILGLPPVAPDTVPLSISLNTNGRSSDNTCDSSVVRISSVTSSVTSSGVSRKLSGVTNSPPASVDAAVAHDV